MAPTIFRRPTRRAPTRSAATPRGAATALPPGSRASRAVTPLVLALGLAAGPGRGASAALQSADGIPELGALSERESGTMRMKLERTIFKVDVLTLGVRVDPATAADIDRLVDAGSDYDEDAAARIAERALSADEVVAEIEFLRDVSLDRFLDAVREDMRKAVEAGWLEPGGYLTVSEGLPGWFDFLHERGIRDGDGLSYHVRGDSLRTVYTDPADTVLLDQTDVGRQHVMALLGAWLAPGSSFREDLIRSLWETAGG